MTEQACTVLAGIYLTSCDAVVRFWAKKNQGNAILHSKQGCPGGHHDQRDRMEVPISITMLPFLCESACAGITFLDR